jgi:hypothetical protein
MLNYGTNIQVCFGANIGPIKRLEYFLLILNIRINKRNGIRVKRKTVKMQRLIKEKRKNFSKKN